MNHIENYIKAVEDFRIFFDSFFNDSDTPELVDLNGIKQYRFKSNDIRTLCVVKFARIISSLNSIVILYQYGHIIEIGVIARSIEESFYEIEFLFEQTEDSKLTSKQTQYLEEFFKENFEDLSDPYSSYQKHTRVPLKDILAGASRTMKNYTDKIMDEKIKQKVHKHINPSDYQKASEVWYKIFSGYAHFSYSQSMEIYGGQPPGFKLFGMNGTSRIEEWGNFLNNLFFKTYNLFLHSCLHFSLEIYELLKAKQIEFQRISGYNPQV